jgi:cation diffusion facilitator family transporter
MTDFLLKMFIEKKQFESNSDKRLAYSLTASSVGIFSNLFLCILKIITGLLINSLAITADGINNLVDVLNSLVGFVGAKLADKPADKEHPFGHGRIEYITAAIASIVIIIVAISLFISSVNGIIEPKEMFWNKAVIIILIVSMGIKLWLALFYKKVFKIINSPILHAASIDSFSDLISTFVSLFSLLIYIFIDIKLDAYVGLIVSLMILWTGLNVFKDSLKSIIGSGISAELYDGIIEHVQNYKEVLGTHDLLIHNYGPNKSMASIHIELPSLTTLEYAHEIADKVEKSVNELFQVNMVVHMDPINVNDENIIEYKNVIDGIIKKWDEKLAFHDLRFVPDSDAGKLIFDIVVPREYNLTNIGLLRRFVLDEVDKKYAGLKCVIVVDYDLRG